MAGVSISDLPPTADSQGTDALPMSRGPTTYKVLISQILAFIQTQIIGIPSGGLATQVLTKISDADYQATWVTSPAQLQSVEIFSISATDITNKYVDIAHIPAHANFVQAFIRGNTPGVYNVDFTMTAPKRFSWDGLYFESIIQETDILTVSYWY
jgi:hypothetical protein